MKRLICLILGVTLIGLVGCDKTKESYPISNEVSSTDVNSNNDCVELSSFLSDLVGLCPEESKVIINPLFSDRKDSWSFIVTNIDESFTLEILAKGKLYSTLEEYKDNYDIFEDETNGFYKVSEYDDTIRVEKWTQDSQISINYTSAFEKNAKDIVSYFDGFDKCIPIEESLWVQAQENCIKEVDIIKPDKFIETIITSIGEKPFDIYINTDYNGNKFIRVSSNSEDSTRCFDLSIEILENENFIKYHATTSDTAEKLENGFYDETIEYCDEENESFYKYAKHNVYMTVSLENEFIDINSLTPLTDLKVSFEDEDWVDIESKYAKEYNGNISIEDEEIQDKEVVNYTMTGHEFLDYMLTISDRFRLDEPKFGSDYHIDGTFKIGEHGICYVTLTPYNPEDYYYQTSDYRDKTEENPTVFGYFKEIEKDTWEEYRWNEDNQAELSSLILVRGNVKITVSGESKEEFLGVYDTIKTNVIEELSDFDYIVNYEELETLYNELDQQDELEHVKELLE